MDTKLTDPVLPKIGKDLLGKLKSGQIIMEQFDQECAYWLMTFIEDMRHKPAPTEPHEIAQYNERRNTEKEFVLPQAFWQQQHIREWLATDHAVRSGNKSNWHWLHFLKKYIPASDVTTHAKISKIMATYTHISEKYVPFDDWRNR